MRTKLLVCGALSFGLFKCAGAPISGTFDMSGLITFTPTTTSWNSNVSPNAANFFTLSGGTGSFATANGQTAINSLNISIEPIGTTFTAQPFITFTQDPSLPGLDITFIYAGTGGSAGCTAAPAAGETCTLTPPGGSPYTFTDDPGNSSTATFTYSGVTSDGLSQWTATLTSQFNQPYQTVIAAFGPGGSGSVSNSYSGPATVSVIITSVAPEPSALILAGAGLIGLSVWSRSRFARRAPIEP
jgi:hypothetical protein